MKKPTMRLHLPSTLPLLVILLTTFATAKARTPEPPFPGQIIEELADSTFSKLGEYRYVYRMFFKLYDAALFVSPDAEPSTILNAETGFRLQFRYLRKIDKSIILKSSAKILEKNLSEIELAQIADRVDHINKAYRSVGSGDRSSLTYIPGRGTTLRINGDYVTTIEGQDFARLYFKIWLGEQSLSPSLTKSLLGG